MWVAENIKWHKSHTELSKYFIEKLKQKVDYNEIISNQHRTSNAYTLIFEIIEVATLTQKRIKSIHRLLSLIEEAKSEFLQSSIVCDYILQEYHNDIIEYYSKIPSNKLKDNGKELSELLNKSKINSIRLKNVYYENIITEIKKIDFSSDDFQRNSITIDRLIDCLIPYLLHQGYSTTSISDIAYRYMSKASGAFSPYEILKNFDNKPKSYTFLIKTQTEKEEFEEIVGYLDSREIEHREVKIGDIARHLFTGFVVEENESLFIIKHNTLDPHNYLRNLYEMSLKNFVSSKDRLNLSFFTNFCDSVYWRFSSGTHKFQKSNMTIDPINVPKRKSTLRSTLQNLSPSLNLNYNESDPLPHIKEIRDSIYYYNLAIGSKSIENSLSLLWTSLETLLPYRLMDNDIENVQYFVSKSLSIGAVGREVCSFGLRLIDVNKVNNQCLTGINQSTSFNYKPESIKEWINWLCTNFETESVDDPYDILKPSSNLLCSQFCYLNDIYSGKIKTKKPIEHWLHKINSSKLSISYQLDRIYLHRNQIVHSGKFINEYSNLWSNLEWYVGKLLSYCIIDYILREDKKTFCKERLFMELDADCDLLINLLEKNRGKNIADLDLAIKLITKNTWQFF
jgi:hypothetical protein